MRYDSLKIAIFQNLQIQLRKIYMPYKTLIASYGQTMVLQKLQRAISLHNYVVACTAICMFR